MNKKQIKQLYQDYMKVKHPTFPTHALPILGSWHASKKGANRLAAEICDICRWGGDWMERTENNPIPIMEKFHHPDQCTTRKFISGYRGGTKQKGTSDLKGLINGQSVYIEIKIGRDKQSPAQIAYQANIEQAGGTYWIIKTLDEFLYYYEQLKTEKL